MSVDTAVHFLESLSLGDNRTTARAVGAVIRRLGHSAAAAITEAELEAFEKDAIKKRFGKKAGGRVRRQKLTSATVGDGNFLCLFCALAFAYLFFVAFVDFPFY